LATLDCLDCGACCFGGEEYVAVTQTDLTRMSGALQSRYVVRKKERIFLKMVQGHCAALHARQGHYSCRMYGSRPNVCKVVEVGSRECLDARRRHNR
jgi:Fe-S-cluster containining protein